MINFDIFSQTFVALAELSATFAFAVAGVLAAQSTCCWSCSKHRLGSR
jgi:hypothetical protein